MKQNKRNRKGSSAAIAWSGGKDSATAFYKAQQQGFSISYLFNMVWKEYGCDLFHAQNKRQIRLQCRALGLPVLQLEVTLIKPKEFWKGFKKGLKILKTKGIDTIVTGDISPTSGQFKMIRKCCRELKIKVYAPLLECKEEELCSTFINAGFKGYVVSTRQKYLDNTLTLLDENWLGRVINKKFVSDIKKLRRKNRRLSLCGESGEYHSYVTDGPIFKKCIEIIKSSKCPGKGFYPHVLNVKKCKLVSKKAR